VEYVNCRASEIESQTELYAPRLARRKRLTEEWSEVWVRAGDADVGMVQRVKHLAAKLDGSLFAD